MSDNLKTLPKSPEETVLCSHPNCGIKELIHLLPGPLFQDINRLHNRRYSYVLTSYYNIRDEKVCEKCYINHYRRGYGKQELVVDHVKVLMENDEIRKIYSCYKCGRTLIDEIVYSS